MARVLVVADVHEPVSHPGYLDFCKDLRREWGCDTTVFIGDVVDFQAISFHAAHPECPGPADEHKLAHQKIAKWCKAFPEATVTIGNHDERVIRLAESVNIPRKFLREYADIWDTPKWTWTADTIIDDVYYFHGTGAGGIHPAFNAAKNRLMSAVMGHCHSTAGVKWIASPQRRVFGMDVGTGIDVAAWNFAYGQHCPKRPILSAGVVLDGVPYHEIMPVGRGERYSKENYR
ncbi:unnamed protein product [marine sediment metagenome]|uniref:Calcineurin-like phosphoesterase domain-containing protein n=1 Tax=marine sediment metagenome TaxID=412755 RepID=X0UJA7_9ZZZZ